MIVPSQTARQQSYGGETSSLYLFNVFSRRTTCVFQANVVEAGFEAGFYLEHL